MMALAAFGMHVRKANRKAGILFVIVRNALDDNAVAGHIDAGL